jgi:membrane fusion protein (multidrug efflux system)
MTHNDSEPDNLSAPAPAVANEKLPRAAEAGSDAPANPPAHQATSAKPTEAAHQVETAPPTAAATASKRRRKLLLWVGAAAAFAVSGHFLVPWIETTMNTESTEDAYVNGHVTYVASRVSGEVAKVLVDDNMRVKKGDLLVQLDKEPYLVQVALKRAAVRVAEAKLTSAEAEARGLEAQLVSQRWKLQSASEQVNAQVALLRSQVAALRNSEAKLDLARADYERGLKLIEQHAMSREEFDTRQQNFRACEAAVNEARETVSKTRVGLGLPAEPGPGKALTDVPSDIDQIFSTVRTSLGEAQQIVAQLGLPLGPVNITPKQALERFHQLDAAGDLDHILDDLVPKSPAVVQAKAQLEQARHDLEQAELNLRYCDIVSQIDGVVTGRNVNPGNNVQVAQSLLCVRSVDEIWIDANFKETQLAELRIGQRVRCEIDMYGGRRELEGRITGFTMGTGQTLALLPPQNATGNFVKIVQRLPVRIELTDYNPAEAPLFVGLSVTPYVYFKEPASGPHAGEVLQPNASLPRGPHDQKLQLTATTSND